MEAKGLPRNALLTAAQGLPQGRVPMAAKGLPRVVTLRAVQVCFGLRLIALESPELSNGTHAKS